MVSFDPKGVKCEKEIGTMVSKSEDNAFCFFSLHFHGKLLPQMINLHKGINWAVWRQPMDIGD